MDRLNWPTPNVRKYIFIDIRNPVKSTFYYYSLFQCIITYIYMQSYYSMRCFEWDIIMSDRRRKLLIREALFELGGDRNKFLFTLGINIGLKIGNIYGKPYADLLEKKTKKKRRLHLIAIQWGIVEYCIGKQLGNGLVVATSAPIRCGKPSGTITTNGPRTSIHLWRSSATLPLRSRRSTSELVRMRLQIA